MKDSGKEVGEKVLCIGDAMMIQEDEEGNGPDYGSNQEENTDSQGDNMGEEFSL